MKVQRDSMQENELHLTGGHLSNLITEYIFKSQNHNECVIDLSILCKSLSLV